MIIKSLTIKNIRSYKEKLVKFSPDTTIITGINGSGKTTLLESVYIALQGKSFKASDGDILSFNTPWWRIDLKTDSSQRVVKFDPSRPTGKKQFVIDDKTQYRLLSKNKYPIVLFEPEDLKLLNGSPSRRRQFIDRFISQLSPLYATNISKYDRALKQRNSLLKKDIFDPDQLFAWDIAIAEYGAYIIEQRIAFIEQINSQLNETYNKIAKTGDYVSIHYSHTIIGDGKQKILTELQTNLQRDRIVGNTSVGPHRHDVIFKFNNSPAQSTASRGENRTIVLALKFLEVAIIEKLTDQKPIILLDDVFSELDSYRQQALNNTITGHQIIMTSTHVMGGGKFKEVKL